MTSGFIGSGTARVRPLGRADFPEGVFAVPANMTQLQITPQAETIQRVSRMRETYGQALDSYIRLQPPQIQITWDGIDHEIFAAVFAGILEPVSANAQTVTDEALTVKKGAWHKLQHRHLDPTTVVVTDSTGGTTYQAGTDYEINDRLGMIFVPETSSIPDGERILVDYETVAFSGYRIRGAKKGAVELEILFDGKNELTGEDVFLHIYSVRTSSGNCPRGPSFLRFMVRIDSPRPEGLSEPLAVSCSLAPMARCLLATPIRSLPQPRWTHPS